MIKIQKSEARGLNDAADDGVFKLFNLFVLICSCFTVKNRLRVSSSEVLSAMAYHKGLERKWIFVVA